MATKEVEEDGASIRALGSLFKLTEVFLWDDSSTNNQRSWQTPKHIRFKYDDEDSSMEEEMEAGIRKSVSNESSETILISDVLPAELDIVREMNSLGLPLSFNTNKEMRNGSVRSEKRAAQKSARRNGQKDNGVARLCGMPGDDEGDASDGAGKDLNDTTSFRDAKTCNLHKHEKHLDKVHINDGDSAVEDICSDISPEQLPDVGGLTDKTVYDGDGNYCFVGCLGDWHVLWDSHYMTNYFYNVKTQESTWHAPPGMESYVSYDLSCESTMNKVVVEGITDESLDGKYSVSEFGGDLGKGIDIEMKPEICAASKECWTTRNSYDMYGRDLGDSLLQVQMKTEGPELCSISREDIASRIKCSDKVFEDNLGEGIVVDMKPELFAVDGGDMDGTTKSIDGLFGGAVGEGVVVKSLTPELDTVSGEDTACTTKNSDELFEGDFGECIVVETKPELYVASRDNSNGTTKGSDELFEGDLGEDTQGEMKSEQYEDDVSGGITKKKKKTRRKRSRKKSSEICEDDQLFECSVESYCGGIGKYWCQRYQLFSKFDEGIQMDEEGWFSVTPELIAEHQASRCQGSLIVDLFAGVGGNTIQFAKQGKSVISIDIDPDKIEYASHNAAIYGVGERIDFVLGDCFSLAPTLKADTVFLSPPWGGPDYLKAKTYDLSMLKPKDGKTIFDTFKEISSMIVMFLPRNVDVNQLAELCLSVDPPWSVEVEKNYLNGKFKAITAYLSKTYVGDL